MTNIRHAFLLWIGSNMEDNYVFVKCKIVGDGRMCYTLEDIVDLVVVGMEYGEYKHNFSVFKDDTIPIDYFDNKQ